MNVTIHPGVAFGSVTAPPSKSMAHRALICAALSEKSLVSNLAFSKDIEATLSCLKALGADCEINDNTAALGGLDINSIPDNAKLFCNESGSTLRFLIPLCMCAGKPVTLWGAKRLFERPLTVYEDIAKAQNITFTKSIDSLTVCGKIKSGEYSVPGDISSQFISGLLFALPILCGDSTLTVTGRFESASYIDLTLAALKDFGIEITRNNNVFYIKGSQRYNSHNHTVEGDCSNAAFLEALNLLGGNVDINGLNPDTLQGDRVYEDIFNGLNTKGGPFDLSDCPDLAPVCFAMAAYLGDAKFTGTARLRIKESDRAAAMAEELNKFRIEVQIYENAVTVKGGSLQKPDRLLYSHNDHRVAMSLSLLCTKVGGTIACAEAVQKSYPDFYNVLKDLKIGLVINED